MDVTIYGEMERVMEEGIMDERYEKIILLSKWIGLLVDEQVVKWTNEPSGDSLVV